MATTPFYARVDADLTKSIAALGQSFIYKGKMIACGITRPAVSNEPMEGGAWDEYAGTIFTRLSSFDVKPPVRGEQITVDGKLVYVGNVKTDQTSPLVTIQFQNNPPPR
jgi:hypothetical protein